MFEVNYHTYLSIIFFTKYIFYCLLIQNTPKKQVIMLRVWIIRIYQGNISIFYIFERVGGRHPAPLLLVCSVFFSVCICMGDSTKGTTIPFPNCFPGGVRANSCVHSFLLPFHTHAYRKSKQQSVYFR